MSDDYEEYEEYEERSGRGKVVLIVVLCLVVAALAATVVFLMMRKSDEAAEAEAPRRNVVVTPDNIDQLLEERALPEFEEATYYTVSMEPTWTFPSGDAPSSNARIDNLLSNTNDVYFDVFLAGDETEPIYESPIIPLGSFLEDVTLEKSLDKGTYDAVCIYHLVDEEQNTLSTLRVAIKIVVES